MFNQPATTIFKIKTFITLSKIDPKPSKNLEVTLMKENKIIPIFIITTIKKKIQSQQNKSLSMPSAILIIKRLLLKFQAKRETVYLKWLSKKNNQAKKFKTIGKKWNGIDKIFWKINQSRQKLNRPNRSVPNQLFRSASGERKKVLRKNKKSNNHQLIKNNLLDFPRRRTKDQNLMFLPSQNRDLTLWLGRVKTYF